MLNYVSSQTPKKLSCLTARPFRKWGNAMGVQGNYKLVKKGHACHRRLIAVAVFSSIFTSILIIGAHLLLTDHAGATAVASCPLTAEQATVTPIRDIK